MERCAQRVPPAPTVDAPPIHAASGNVNYDLKNPRKAQKIRALKETPLAQRIARVFKTRLTFKKDKKDIVYLAN